MTSPGWSNANSWYRQSPSAVRPPARHRLQIPCLIISVVLSFMALSWLASLGSVRALQGDEFAGTNLKDVFNETLGFEKVFIVGLPEREDKFDSNIIASSLTGFKFTPMPGIRGKDVSFVSLPPTYDPKKDAGTIGAWRAELNTVRRVISEGLSSALVVEDDIDWDVSLKTQLRNVALGSRYLSNPNHTAPFSASSIKPHSPYGDDWDILWLGHCGIGISGDKRRSRILNDPTTPADGRLHTPAVGMSPKEYAGDGTRVMFKTGGGSCSWTYAVSFKGARKLLNAMSVEPFNNGFDNGLGRLCSGLLNCVSIYPPIFGAHAPMGITDKESDINKDGGKFRDKGRTHNVAYNMKNNFKELLNGEEPKPQWDDMPIIKDEVKLVYS